MDMDPVIRGERAKQILNDEVFQMAVRAAQGECKTRLLLADLGKPGDLIEPVALLKAIDVLLDNLIAFAGAADRAEPPRRA